MAISISVTPISTFGNDKKQLYVGVLETKHFNWPEDPNKNDSSTKKIVRALFYKSGKNWFSLQNDIANNDLYPLKADWTIAFDGRNIGQFKSEFAPLRFDKPWTFPRDAYHKPLSNNLPTLGQPTEEFSGWPMYKNPRPLVVVSEPHYSDREKWMPFSPTNSLIENLLPEYNGYLSKYNLKDSTGLSNIQKFKSYTSIKGYSLIQIGLFKNAYRTWFHVSPNNSYRNLSEMVDAQYKEDEFGDDDISDMYLVDAGDYDGNNETEIIFWVARYNRDGYVIFYNECSAFAEFTWSYH